MEKKITRIKGSHFCTLEVELSEQDGKTRLSICGVYGDVLRRAEAKKQSLEYWKSYFEENPSEIMDMNKRFNKRFTSPGGAARFVLETDGDFHGLDVVSESDGQVLNCTSWGQIREELARFFPEVVPYFQYHLNDMNAGCKHQRALGWGNDQIGIPCPECGYKYGAKWLYEPLPPEVIAWVEGL